MALAVMGSQGSFHGKILNSHVFMGELSLDDSVRPVRGALSAAIVARDRWAKNVVVPIAIVREATVFHGIAVFAVNSLVQAADLVNARKIQLERYSSEKIVYAISQMPRKMI